MNLKKLSEHFSLIPLRLPPDNPKAPKPSNWTKYAETKIDWPALVHQRDLKGNFGVVCGFEGLQVVDVDNHFERAKKALDYITDNFPTPLPTIQTPSGGYHLYFKCTEIEGNKELAYSRIVENDIEKHELKGKIHYLPYLVGDKSLKMAYIDNEWVGYDCVIETRGKGGQVVYYDNVVNGDIYQVPTLEPAQRAELLEICRSFSQKPKHEKKYTPSQSTDLSPIDAYHADPRAPELTKALLRENGWVATNESEEEWTRPGKNSGVSATWGRTGKNQFYVWTPNAPPFEATTRYSMAAVRTELAHGGDYSKCAAELARMYNIAPPAHKSKTAATRYNKKWNALEEIIKEWKLTFRYNEITGVIDYRRGKGAYEQLKLLPGDLIYEMERNRGIEISATKLKDMLKNSRICKIYNPVKSFFRALPKHDGEAHIKALCAHISLAENEDPDFFYSMLKKQLIRSVRCALDADYSNRFVFTFYGPQEIGKSKLIEWLFKDKKELYYAEPIETKDKDSILALSKYMCINLDDIDELTKKGIGALKAFISRGDITKRVVYGHYDEKYQRISSFWASTNKDFLSDEVNTRWLILNVEGFDWQKYTTEIDPAKIWAEALHYYNENAESGELSKDEKTERERRNNSQFLATTAEREVIQKHFYESDYKKMTCTDIKIAIEKEMYPLKVNHITLNKELRRLFGQPVATSYMGRSGRYYSVEPDFDISNGTGQNSENKGQTSGQGDDLPF